MHKKFYIEYLKGRDHLGNLDIDGSILFKWILNNYYMTLWTGFMWLRIRTSGRLL
jgi:hypothetical protein